MTKPFTGCGRACRRARLGRAGALALAWALAGAALAEGETPPAASAASAASAPAPAPAAASAASAPASAARVVLRWRPVPRVTGRLTAAALGVVVNDADPYSVEVGAYYVRQRRIAPEHVVHVTLPVRPRLSAAELEDLRRQLDQRLPVAVQALALAWVQPYAAQCQSITGALAFGIDAELCARTCDKAQLSPYFNSPSTTPFTDFGWRPSMLLAARSVAQARQLIDRGVAADHGLGLRGAPPVRAEFVVTSDAARSVRAPLFPPPGLLRDKGVQVVVSRADVLPERDRLLLLQTGAARLEHLERLHWVSGGLADHLTSFGGLLDRSDGQTNALAWIEAGATASYGTVSEPCNHPQKFPHPQVLLLHYLQGQTALEAYWKSVAWPQQGVFVGEPLAAPFAPRAAEGGP